MDSYQRCQNVWNLHIAYEADAYSEFWKCLISSYCWLPESPISSTVTLKWPFQTYLRKDLFLLLPIYRTLNLVGLQTFMLAWNCTAPLQNCLLRVYTSRRLFEMFYLYFPHLHHKGGACMWCSSYHQRYMFRFKIASEKYFWQTSSFKQTADGFCSGPYGVWF